MTRSGATVRDIAQVAGVSAASVSRALRDPDRVSDKTRERIRGALDQIEGIASRNGKPAVSTIGCLFIDSTSGPRFTGFDATIWSGIARVAMTRGAEVLMINLDSKRPHDRVADLLRRRGVGALAVRLDEGSEHILDDIAASGIPALVIAHQCDNPAIGSIRVRSRKTSRDAVEHLINLGHRRIAFCRNIVSDQDHYERYLGYRDALEHAGIQPDEDLEIQTLASAEGGVTAINRLLALPDAPSAVYFADPIPTIGALRRLRELGIDVPSEFSVIGFDDDDARLLGSPVYTAVCQDAPALAVAAGQLLCRMMQGTGPQDPPRIELDSYLEINGTTARPPTNLISEPRPEGRCHHPASATRDAIPNAPVPSPTAPGA